MKEAARSRTQIELYNYSLVDYSEGDYFIYNVCVCMCVCETLRTCICKLCVIMGEYIFGQGKLTLCSFPPHNLTHAPVLLHHSSYMMGGYLTMGLKNKLTVHRLSSLKKEFKKERLVNLFIF